MAETGKWHGGSEAFPPDEHAAQQAKERQHEQLRRDLQELSQIVNPVRIVSPTEAISAAMANDRRRQLQVARRQRRAKEKVDDFLLWAYDKPANHTKNFDPYSFLYPSGGVATMVTGYCVLERYLDFVFEFGPDLTEDQQIEHAHAHTDHPLRPLEEPLDVWPVRFTPAGLKRARSLWWARWRKKWLWLPMAFIRPLKKLTAWLYVATGFVLAKLVSSEKLLEAVPKLWEWLKSFWIAHHP